MAAFSVSRVCVAVGLVVPAFSGVAWAQGEDPTAVEAEAPVPPTTAPMATPTATAAFGTAETDAPPPATEPLPPLPAAEPVPQQPPMTPSTRDDAMVARRPPPPADYEPMAPPPEEEATGKGKGFEMPPWSVRVDPLNWLLEGRLGVELEAGLWKFLSVELVPMFITSEQPPTLDLGSFPDALHQQSNGLGPMSGVSASVGIWLEGKPFQGLVLRPFFSAAGYRYESKQDGVHLDSVDRSEKLLGLMIGSQNTWIAFTISYGFGLAKEMGDQRRCFTASSLSSVSSSCSDDVQEIAVRNTATAFQTLDMNGSLHPYYLVGRLSLGVAFE
jgi:hypothetical protein